MRIITTRRKHDCCGCGAEMPKGSRMLAIGVDCGMYARTYRLCLYCGIRKAQDLMADMHKLSSGNKTT